MWFFIPIPRVRYRRRCRSSSPENNAIVAFIFLGCGVCSLIFAPLRAAGVDVDHAPVLGTIVGIIGFGITGLLWWGLSGLRRERQRPQPQPPPTHPLWDKPTPAPMPPAPQSHSRQQTQQSANGALYGIGSLISGAAIFSILRVDGVPAAWNLAVSFVSAFVLAALAVWGLNAYIDARRRRRFPPPPPSPFDWQPPPDPAPLPVSPKPSPRPLNRQAPIDRPYPWRPYY